MASNSYFRMTVIADGRSEVTDLPGAPCFTADDIERIADERVAAVERELGKAAFRRIEWMEA